MRYEVSKMIEWGYILKGEPHPSEPETFRAILTYRVHAKSKDSGIPFPQSSGEVQIDGWWTECPPRVALQPAIDQVTKEVFGE